MLLFPKQPNRLKIGLHLQGGAAFGLWQANAVMHVLKNPELFEIVYITGTSAGAMNAALITQAINKSPNDTTGYAQAILSLETFWSRLQAKSRGYMEHVQHAQSLYAASGYCASAQEPNLPILEEMARCASLSQSFSNALRLAYSFMPLAGIFAQAVIPDMTRHMRNLTTHAMRELICDHVSLETNKKLSHTNGRVKLYMNAAKIVATGYEDRCFGPDDISLDSMMASAALKDSFHPVRIEGDDYLDGGYTANPSFTPLNKHRRDVSAVLHFVTNRPQETTLVPMRQSDIPRQDLADSRDLVLHHALREVAFEVEQGQGPTHHLVLFDHPAHCTWTAKQNTTPKWMRELAARGQADGMTQIQNQWPYMGVRSTISRQALMAMAKNGSAHLNQQQKRAAA